MEQRAAGDAIRAARPTLVASWLDRAPDVPPGHAAAVLGVLAYAADSGPTAGAVAFGALLEYEPDLRVGVEQLAALRTVLHRHLSAELPASDVLAALEDTNRIIDGLAVLSTARLVEELSSAALADPLTRAGNRRAFDRDAPRALALARRQDQELAVIALDLDGLKKINDSKGHAAGDESLRALITAVTPQLREADGVYRIGGDEFLVLLSGTGPAGAAVFIDRAAATAPMCTFGIASAPQDGWALEGLLAIADERLLSAKRARPGRAAVGAGRFGAAGVLAAGLAVPSATSTLSPMLIRGVGLAAAPVLAVAAAVALTLGRGADHHVTPPRTPAAAPTSSAPAGTPAAPGSGGSGVQLPFAAPDVTGPEVNQAPAVPEPAAVAAAVAAGRPAPSVRRSIPRSATTKPVVPPPVLTRTTPAPPSAAPVLVPAPPGVPVLAAPSLPALPSLPTPLPSPAAHKAPAPQTTPAPQKEPGRVPAPNGSEANDEAKTTPTTVASPPHRDDEDRADEGDHEDRDAKREPAAKAHHHRDRD